MRTWVYTASLALAAGLFIVDLLLPRGPAPAIGYCAAVVLAGESRSSQFAIGFTLLCSLLTWVGYFLEPHGSPAWMSALNRSMVMGVIWLTAGLSILRLRALTVLERQTQDLARSNRDLEQFASIAAHDLRSPLATIDGSIELLAQHWEERLDSESLELLGFVRAGTRRMTGLIRSLLDYARAGARHLALSDCSVEEALGETVAGLRTVLDSAGAEVVHDPLPVVRADPIQLRQVLQNLIENAVKYRRSEPPRIRVSARLHHREWVFTVEDNGAGIPSEELGRIFELYERASSSSSDAGGLGVGLATCRKIIERHGGRIWAQSTPGSGSVFLFTLPDRPGPLT